MDNLPESTMNLLIGGIFGILSAIITALFNGIILWALKRDELMLKHRLDMLAKRQELLLKHQQEAKQKEKDQGKT